MTAHDLGEDMAANCHARHKIELFWRGVGGDVGEDEVTLHPMTGLDFESDAVKRSAEFNSDRSRCPCLLGEKHETADIAAEIQE